METNLGFNKYMDRFFQFKGRWDSPSICGLKIITRKDGKVLVIASEILRQNPGTSVTDWCAPLATQIITELRTIPENFIFIEHAPDLQSRLAWYAESFDLVNFEWDDEKFINPKWTRLTRDQVDELMED